MEELTLTTPSLLFSAVSLIMLAYTNRFLSYAQVVRTLKGDYDLHPTRITAAQIDNLRKRLSLIRTMQILGIVSLLLSVLCMFLIYIGFQTSAVGVFAISLLCLICSLGISIGEIVISVRALDLHLSEMERQKLRKHLLMILYIHKKVSKRLLKKAKSDILSDIFCQIFCQFKKQLYICTRI